MHGVLSQKALTFMSSYTAIPYGVLQNRCLHLFLFQHDQYLPKRSCRLAATTERYETSILSKHGSLILHSSALFIFGRVRKIAKWTTSFAMSVCPHETGSHQTDFFYET